MKIYKITEASDYLGVSINTLKTLANNGKIKSFKTSGGHRRFRQDDLDSYMGVPATSKRSVCAGCGRFIRSVEGHYVYDGRRWCVGCYEKGKGGRCH